MRAMAVDDLRSVKEGYWRRRGGGALAHIYYPYI